jgi:hypothetical protein
LILTANGVIKNRVENSKIFGRFFMIPNLFLGWEAPAIRLLLGIAFPLFEKEGLGEII